MSSKSQTHDVKGAVFVRILTLIGKLPLPTLGLIGDMLGYLAWYIAPGPRNVTLKNLELCFPDMDAAERTSLAKASLRETLRTALEVAAAWSQTSDRMLSYITHAENEQLLVEAQAAGKGIVFIVPHFGNWELANYYMAKKCDLLAMYKPAESCLLYTSPSPRDV